MRSIAIIMMIAFALIGCNEKRAAPAETKPADSASTKTVVINNDSIILSLTKQVLSALKTKEYRLFAEFIHPVEGTRFSPYGYIDTAADVKFTTKEFLSNVDQQPKINWGSYDGSGDTLLLTIAEYFKKFVYNADFLHAEKTSINKMISAGNSLNNLETIYKDSNYTESYFSGFDKKYGGMDWTCLRLVYRTYNGKFFLVAVVHDQWTI